jgi:hypothetical protein
MPVADRKPTANKRTIKGTSINYPTVRKSKLNHDGNKAPAKYADKELLAIFKTFHGEPNPTRRKRALIAKFNPLHFAFGNTLPIWKTYQTYAQNMGLLETDYEAT